MGYLKSPPHVVDRLQILLEEGRRDELLGYFMREVAGLPPDQVELLRSLPAWEARLDAAETIPREERASREYVFDPARFRDLDVPTLYLQGGDSSEPFKAAGEALRAALPDCRRGLGEGEAAPVEGRNDFRPMATGPCRPPCHGRHSYSVRLDALDSDPGLRPRAGKRDVEHAVEGHTAKAELIGSYERWGSPGPVATSAALDRDPDPARGRIRGEHPHARLACDERAELGRRPAAASPPSAVGPNGRRPGYIQRKVLISDGKEGCPWSPSEDCSRFSPSW
jgi:hypothetical protein